MKNELTKTDKYEPSVRLKRFVAMLFKHGSKTEAEKITNYDRRNFYKHLKDNDRFRKWYNKQVDIFSEGLMAKALKTLEEVMDDTESQSARVSAVRAVLELLGRIKGGNANIEREPVKILKPINVFNQQINISREDYTKAIEFAEAAGLPKEEIEEAKRLRDELAQ